ncbi:hypothetical protein ARMGADRAFT_1015348 [Armillaria gallica]|uniref:Uncharacterized protein n=1 Tax=Armillaria gallica TaxID=47427 RepID=A0A2H3D4Z4_ARMGA|nr:hypothetical protein ARMGADRAFT_1015348 [Armillaria gallica]
MISPRKSKRLSSRFANVFDDKFWERHHYYSTEVRLASMEHIIFCSVLETMQPHSLFVSRLVLNCSLVQAIASLLHLRILKLNHEYFDNEVTTS